MCVCAQTDEIRASTFAVPVLLEFIFRHQDLTENHLLVPSAGFTTDYSQGAILMRNNSRPPPTRNNLLAALPRKEYKRLIPHLEYVRLPFMVVLYEGGEPIEHVYFPNDGLISLLVVMSDKTPKEVGLIGNDGMLGTAVALGMKTTPIRALVLMPGSAMRMKAQALRGELKQGGALQGVLQRYSHALFAQISQSAACVSSHAVDRRLSRWLLMMHDRAPGDEFEMKHEFMAMMLGVTRSVVTRAAGRLQKETMIHYTRGRVAVLDRRGLEATACECYAVVKEEYARSSAESRLNGRLAG
jgi:CRP-like cAMP-binding protein